MHIFVQSFDDFPPFFTPTLKGEMEENHQKVNLSYDQESEQQACSSKIPVSLWPPISEGTGFNNASS